MKLAHAFIRVTLLIVGTVLLASIFPHLAHCRTAAYQTKTIPRITEFRLKSYKDAHDGKMVRCAKTLDYYTKPLIRQKYALGCMGDWYVIRVQE